MEAMSPEGYVYYYNTETGGEVMFTNATGSFQSLFRSGSFLVSWISGFYRYNDYLPEVAGITALKMGFKPVDILKDG